MAPAPWSGSSARMRSTAPASRVTSGLVKGYFDRFALAWHAGLLARLLGHAVLQRVSDCADQWHGLRIGREVRWWSKVFLN
jgi:hypothetical protein